MTGRGILLWKDVDESVYTVDQIVRAKKDRGGLMCFPFLFAISSLLSFSYRIYMHTLLSKSTVYTYTRRGFAYVTQG